MRLARSPVAPKSTKTVAPTSVPSAMPSPRLARAPPADATGHYPDEPGPTYAEPAGLGPLLRMLTTLPSTSNQNGAPNERAKTVMSQPSSLSSQPWASDGVSCHPSGICSDFASSMPALAAAAAEQMSDCAELDADPAHDPAGGVTPPLASTESAAATAATRTVGPCQNDWVTPI